MYYGHGSWIAIAIFAGMFAVRALSSPRRRGSQTSRNSFTTTHPGDRPTPTTGAPERDGTTVTGVAPGWFTDPFGRHDHRYWSGTEWTEHVDDHGTPGVDPPPPPSGPRHEG
jgi:hypothetical protein